jgi:tripartite ATP-independent transporter DctP family solute receptor
VLAVAACGGKEQPASSASGFQGKPVTIKFSTPLPATDPEGLGAEKFKELVEKYSKGTITVNIYPNNQLGGETDVFPQLKQGSIQTMMSASGTAGTLVPDISVMDAPYIWKDWANEKKVMSGPVFKHFQQEFESSQNLELLSGSWYYGVRDLSCSKKILTPNDATGLKIRTPPAPVNLLSARVLGGQGVPMQFPQVYLALKTGTIDCEENPLPTIMSAKLYEVNKFIMLTHHIQQSQLISMNLDFWKGLSKDQQDAVKKAVSEAGDYETQVALTTEKDDVDKLKGLGVTIVTTPDLKIADFVANARKLDPELKDKWGSYYDQIISAQK